MQTQEQSRISGKKRYFKLRGLVLNKLGNKCKNCNTHLNLQLHHNYYASDSVRPKIHNENGYKTILRMQEAMLHPERFSLLCLSCHNKIEPRLPHLKPNVNLELFEKIRGW